MTLSNVVVGIGVNILVPLLGLIAFVLLCRTMRQSNVESPPFFYVFILFATYGGWLMVLLTALFWEWSGMASLGVLYLVLIAPFVTGGIALGLRTRYALSVFHRVAFIASIVYSGLMVVTLGVWVWYSRSAR